MTSDNPNANAASVETVDETTTQSAADLERYGITAHQQASYEWNGYRYSKASDAIAAAKRAERPAAR